MRLFCRRKKMTNGWKDKEIKESEEKLKETHNRWPEVHEAQRRLEQWIEQALRGGHI